MNAPIRIYVPRAALAVDADAVARAIEAAAEQRGLAVQLVRNGSRGLLWLEPMVEVATPAGRVAYGPVQPGGRGRPVRGRLAAGRRPPAAAGSDRGHPLPEAPGTPDLARVGVTDPLSLQDYAAHGGLEGLKRALSLAPEAIVQELIDSDCAARRRGLPHRHQMEDGGRHAGRPEIHRSATPTKAIPAPTPTAC